MSRWSTIKQTYQRLMSEPKFKQFISSPVVKLVGINTALFLLWRINGVSETFLVKHFSFERFNIREHRYHTLVTHAFSNFGFFSYLLNMFMLGSFGQTISRQFGKKVVWWLYLLGAFAGGLSMYFGMPHMGMVAPQTGAGPAISSLITFYGLFNLRNSVLLFFFPVKIWFLLGTMALFSLLQPSKSNLGGMFAGLIVYQLFKIKII